MFYNNYRVEFEFTFITEILCNNQFKKNRFFLNIYLFYSLEAESKINTITIH